MRDIRFKAKRLGNDEWVKGDLLHTKTFAFITWFENGFRKLEKVDPSTICQFTGMRDWEGKEIWEGDIVRDNYDLLCVDNFYEVVYIEEEGAFAFKSLDKVDNYEPFVNLFEAYVVGNKFDKEK